MAIQQEKMPFDPADDIRKYGNVPGDASPKPRATRTTTPKTPAADQPTMVEVRKSLEDIYALVGNMLAAYPNPRLAMVGQSIASHAESCAESIVEAAKKDPKLKRALLKMTTAGAYSGIFMAHMPILMAGYVAFKLPVETLTAQPADETTDTPPDLFSGNLA